MENPVEKLSLALSEGLLVKGADFVQSLAAREKPEAFLTGVDALDGAQDGGLRPGSLIELVGAGSSGRFSVALFALAAATQTGDSAAFLDSGGHFDPQQAERVGVQLDRLLWLSPQTISQTLLSAELLLQSGFFLVVIDLGIGTKPHIVPNSVWLRLARAAQEHKAIVLVSSETPLEALASDAVIYSQQTTASWQGEREAPSLLSAITVQWRLRQRRGSKREKAVTLSLLAP